MNLNCGYKGIEIRQYKRIIRKELFRKSIHLCSAFIPLLLSRFYYLTLGLLAFAVIAYIVFEVCRIHGKKIFLISAITVAASRNRNSNKFVLGPVTLVLGIILSAVLCEPKAAAVGIYCLAFGDGLASLVGKLIGTIPLPFTKGKTVAGSLTCFVAAFCAVCVYTGNTAFSLCIAYIAMFIELLPLKDFDNLFIPVLIGITAQLLLPVI